MKIALVADLHFGSVPEGLSDLLGETIEGEKPDLIVIAGDLTLRARKREFRQAASWLEALKAPILVLPGNHDLPYWNLLQRFADPFGRFRHAAAAKTLMPIYEGAGGYVLGFNTTGSWQPHLRWQEGVARRTDIIAAKLALDAAPPQTFKAVAGHHPFSRVPGIPRARPVRRAAAALQAFASAGVEVLLSGHIHLSFAVEVEIGSKRIVSVGAPTALSSRMRGEANGFWIVEEDGGAIFCRLWLRGGKGFAEANSKSFQRFSQD